MATVAQTLLAIVLLVSAALKLRDPRHSAEALATYGVGPAGLRLAVLASLAGAELAVGIALAAGIGWAAPAAAGLFAMFALAGAAALAAGRAGRPCACFGAGSRLTRVSPLAALGAGLLALAVAERWLPRRPARRALAGAGAFAVHRADRGARLAMLAVAREVGVLRLSPPASGALEIAEEGPAVGEREAWAEQLELRSAARSRTRRVQLGRCPMCRRVAPAVRTSQPIRCSRCASSTSSPTRRSGARRRAGKPLCDRADGEGVTLAKGTFNSLGQLESMLATARARSGGSSCRLSAVASRRRAARGERPPPLSPSGAAQQQPARLPGVGRHGIIALAGADDCPGCAAGRGRRVHELLRSHLHDRQLPGADRAAAGRRHDYRCAPPTASGGRPGASDQRAGPAGRRAGTGAARTDGEPLAPAPRSKVCPAAGDAYGLKLKTDGSWYRCCGGRVRRMRDCCGVTNERINGDEALVGYCYPGRHVFCVTYFQTLMPC